MNKPFNIHDWQAKQRLAEAKEVPDHYPHNWKDLPGYNTDYFYPKKQKIAAQEVMHKDDVKLLQDLSQKYSLDKIITNLKVIYKSMTEMSTTGTGASFNAGSGEGYMTPNAFKKKKK